MGREETHMKYYDVRKPLYLETDASGVALGTASLQVKDNLSCGYVEVPANSMHQSTTFARKSLSVTE